jgi:acetolactate synthase-1/2/3 large subunit
VIVAGGGVRASGAGAELVALAEALSIPVATSLNAKDCIPGTHPLSVGVVGSYSRESANRVVAAADLVCFIGTSAGGMTTHAWQVPKIGVAALQIDIEPQVIGRNYPLKAGVLGDARVCLSMMLEAAGRSSASRRKPWVEQVQGICKEWREKYRGLLESDAVPIRPERIFMRSAGHLGWAFPAGLGAKCAARERPVVTFTGDAGLWYHIGEIETAVRWNIAAVTVVNNNASGNQSKRGFDRAYGGEQTPKARELWTYRMVDFARLAADIGALGIRVERAADFAPALEKALKAGKPAIIDVVTDIEAIAPIAVSG